MFKTVLLTVTFIGTILSFSNAAIEEHRVDSLPGFVGALPSTHYSGLLPTGTLTGTAGHLHYWFIESTNNPSTDPFVVWFNGGPGSSSLIGLLTENGQVVLNDDSLDNLIDGVPQLYVNEYAWTTVANVLWLESPKGVGFSYCDSDRKSVCVNTDESTAIDAYEFLVNWFTAFPEYKSNKFYITGESYAGIYIPMLIEQIDLNPLGYDFSSFVGAAIGNGCIGNTVGTCAFGSGESISINVEFLHGHGLYSQALYSEIVAACGDYSTLTAKCIAKVAQMNVEAGDFNVYNIYDECGSDQRRRRLRGGNSSKLSWYEVSQIMAEPSVYVSTNDSFKVSAGYTQALNDYVCGAETAMDVYLALPVVADALHVTLGTQGQTYTKTVTSLLPLYASLVEKHQILIYSGDVDGCVPFTGTENWTRALGFDVKNDWHQWYSIPDGYHELHKAGYAVEFDNFQFVSINGAGHMVPQYQPAFALTMFKKFLNDEKF